MFVVQHPKLDKTFVVLAYDNRSTKVGNIVYCLLRGVNIVYCNACILVISLKVNTEVYIFKCCPL